MLTVFISYSRVKSITLCGLAIFTTIKNMIFDGCLLLLLILFAIVSSSSICDKTIGIAKIDSNCGEWHGAPKYQSLLSTTATIIIIVTTIENGSI